MATRTIKRFRPLYDLAGDLVNFGAWGEIDGLDTYTDEADQTINVMHYEWYTADRSELAGAFITDMETLRDNVEAKINNNWPQPSGTTSTRTVTALMAYFDGSGNLVRFEAQCAVTSSGQYRAADDTLKSVTRAVTYTVDRDDLTTGFIGDMETLRTSVAAKIDLKFPMPSS
jgi:hypothetical protein